MAAKSLCKGAKVGCRRVPASRGRALEGHRHHVGSPRQYAEGVIVVRSVTHCQVGHHLVDLEGRRVAHFNRREEVSLHVVVIILARNALDHRA